MPQLAQLRENMKFRQHKQQSKKPGTKARHALKESKPRGQSISSSSRSNTKEDVEAAQQETSDGQVVALSMDAFVETPQQEYAQDTDLFQDLHEFLSFE
jgi:hypothetical protein